MSSRWVWKPTYNPSTGERDGISGGNWQASLWWALGSSERSCLNTKAWRRVKEDTWLPHVQTHTHTHLFPCTWEHSETHISHRHMYIWKTLWIIIFILCNCIIKRQIKFCLLSLKNNNSYNSKPRHEEWLPGTLGSWAGSGQINVSSRIISGEGWRFSFRADVLTGEGLWRVTYRIMKNYYTLKALIKFLKGRETKTQSEHCLLTLPATESPFFQP